VGQKIKIAKKGSIFFPIWAKNNFELGKKKYLVAGAAQGQKKCIGFFLNLCIPSPYQFNEDVSFYYNDLLAFKRNVIR
jgi:hypothetical protein